MTKRVMLTVLALVAGAVNLRSQLAITEIQTSEAAFNTLGARGPDWWELSNLGAGDIDLTGYLWNDDHSVFGADAPFGGITIHAGESIVITETNAAVFDATTFRQWWGISPSVQVVVSSSQNGLSGTGGDTVRLWTPAAASATDPNDPEDLVDRVDVGPQPLSTNVPTFIYDPINGTFDFVSTNGIGGAFQAATASDVGSPGAPPGAGPMAITQQPGPKNFTAPVGVPFSYTVAAYGLPKPHFIWLFNGAPADTTALAATVSFTITNNRSLSTLSIASVQLADQGAYSVIVSNGMQTSLISSNAVLTVTASALAPQINSFPQSTWAYPGQTVTFSVDAFGSPSPTYQWKHNGTNLPGEIGPQLLVSVSDSNTAGTYSVGMTNSAGNTNASAALTVTPKPNLRITEVMSSAAPGAGHNDWWELSNLGGFAVSLRGFRFDDNSFSLANAYVVTNDILIAPNESVVLAEDMTPAGFSAWWGTNQLPPNLQIIDYHGSGLSFSSGGDSLTVWNAAAGNEGDYLDSVSFDAAAQGVSFTYDPGAGNFAGSTNVPGGISALGFNGAYVAAESGDIGSPGAIVNTPRFISILKTDTGFALTWVSQPNFKYAVQYKTNLADPNWTTLTTVMAGNTNAVGYTDASAVGPRRLYRLILNP